MTSLSETAPGRSPGFAMGELGKTVVAVTHDLTFASAADQRVGIVDGLIAPDWRA